MASRHRRFLRRGFLRVSRLRGRQSRDRRLGRERHTSRYDGLESEAGQRSSADDELRNQYTLSVKIRETKSRRQSIGGDCEGASPSTSFAKGAACSATPVGSLLNAFLPKES